MKRMKAKADPVRGTESFTRFTKCDAPNLMIAWLSDRTVRGVRSRLR